MVRVVCKYPTSLQHSNVRISLSFPHQEQAKSARSGWGRSGPRPHPENASRLATGARRFLHMHADEVKCIHSNMDTQYAVSCPCLKLSMPHLLLRRLGSICYAFYDHCPLSSSAHRRRTYGVCPFVTTSSQRQVVLVWYVLVAVEEAQLDGH